MTSRGREWGTSLLGFETCDVAAAVQADAVAIPARSEDPLHSPCAGDRLVELSRLCVDELPPPLLSLSASSVLQQFVNLVQREAKPLGEAQEPQPIHGVRAVTASS